jgi:hypothetical protein
MAKPVTPEEELPEDEQAGEESEAPRPRKPPRPTRISPLQELTLCVGQALVIVTGIVIAGVSRFSGATWLDTLLRSGAAVLALGLLAWLVNWIIAAQELEAAHRALLAAAQPASSVEKGA